MEKILSDLCRKLNSNNLSYINFFFFINTYPLKIQNNGKLLQFTLNIHELFVLNFHFNVNKYTVRYKKVGKFNFSFISSIL